ncbi:hypothetical protein ACWGQT_21725 [Streptomyces yangpuensis]|uniref:Uncharacterized protein n=1 Tax=Streptomyces yangpuensis TaxID=1648182 RepID=A0ABY5Q2V6_9ACTN|nr:MULTISPECIES: hypothetical protein [Streptomyces]MBZ9598992.1 hypothetical protein [Streptomyces erythrochromogenes]UUY50767.1 hypothetical protein NRK68_28155 [Streptomyces yangpuensis]
MRITVIRVLATLAAGAAVLVTGAAGASAAPAPTQAAVAPAHRSPADAAGWVFLGEYSKRECVSLRDSYAGRAKCVRNAGGLYDLYVWQ